MNGPYSDVGKELGLLNIDVAFLDAHMKSEGLGSVFDYNLQDEAQLGTVLEALDDMNVGFTYVPSIGELENNS